MTAPPHGLLVDKAAARLPPAQFRTFRRMARELFAHFGRWGLFLLKYSHRDDMLAVSQALDGLGKRIARVDAAPFGDWPSFEAALVEASANTDLIEVQDLNGWLNRHPDPQRAQGRMRAWNIRRDAYAATVCVPLLCWLRPDTLRTFASTAPDLWSWRAGVSDFVLERSADGVAPPVEIRPELGPVDNRTADQKTLRMREIRQYLDGHPVADGKGLALRGALLDELASLSSVLGQDGEALRIWREESLPVYEKLGDARAVALTVGRIADVLHVRGDLDEALRIRLEEELPVYAQLGDMRELAVTKGKIADVLQARGEFGKALRIRREEELPVLEGLGDVRAVAVTEGKIAEALQAGGEFDEALRVRREAQLPVFEKLGDALSVARTKGNIADLLQARGELDQALRIWLEEVLPTFERLGDVRAAAVTMGRIANIHHARGELEESLRIRREQVLPMLEKLGDLRQLALERAFLAAGLMARAKTGDREEALSLLQLALASAQKMRVHEAAEIKILLGRCQVATSQADQKTGKEFLSPVAAPIHFPPLPGFVP